MDWGEVKNCGVANSVLKLFYEIMKHSSSERDHSACFQRTVKKKQVWVCISACETGNQTHLKWHVKLTLTLPSKYISTFIQGMFASSGAHNKSAWTDKNHNSWHEAPWHKKTLIFYGWIHRMIFLFVCYLMQDFFLLKCEWSNFGRVIEMIEIKLQANSQQTFSEVYKFSLKQPSCKHYAHLNFSHGWLVACFHRTHLYIWSRIYCHVSDWWYL